ncbi:UNVERIFIED_CONTAM: cytochrome [Sesamum calycinum]|uniref:Cytochrome n=1 Tax=Sesamum calycinum TaxID=2727403 RepID=A0AAW2R959_9LAMI
MGGKSCGGGRSVRKRKRVTTGRRKGEAAALGEVVGVRGGARGGRWWLGVGGGGGGGRVAVVREIVMGRERQFLSQSSGTDLKNRTKMFGTIVIIAVLVLVVRGAWRFLDTYWFRPKELEKILRKQGLTGNPYRFFFGDARETGKMFKESYSKPIGITDDIAPRVIPFVVKTLKTYGILL